MKIIITIAPFEGRKHSVTPQQFQESMQVVVRDEMEERKEKELLVRLGERGNVV